MIACRALLTIACVCASLRASAQSGSDGRVTPPLSPRNASYSIDARLDPATRTITGSETISWRNITSKPASELRFHLYWNGWRDLRSTWLREATLGGQRFDRRADEWARIDVERITMGSANDVDVVDLTRRMTFISPDDGNPDDRTVIAVALPAPVPPGGTASVDVTWTAHVPRTFARTGAIGRFFFIAQWFPKLGVLEDEGWNCHQFHAGTEFFSDYGVYDVRLTVPKGWIVGATGVERERRDNNDQTSTHRYYQEDVHDFAWTTSPDYVVRTARFEHPSLPPVEMRLLLQPEHLQQAGRHFDATRNTLANYGEWFGAYAYDHITIVDPAYQSRVDGMEYPTLFTAGTDWIVVPKVLNPEGVIIHEAGHQWWYGMVGSNEFEDAWMDEGFNTFSEARVEAYYRPSNPVRRYFGGFVPYALRDITLSREIDRNRFDLYRASAKSDAQSTPSYKYFPGRLARNATSYAKTALSLNTLERHLGWPVLQRVMSTYFERWRFRHPKPQDFFGVLNEITGRDFEWYVDQTYRSSNVFDYGVDSLETSSDASQFRTTVVVRRYGEAVFPITVRVSFADGEQINEHWEGRDRWQQYAYVRSAPAVAAEVDPDHVLLLDINATNNSKSLAPRGPDAAMKWSLKWMVWLQDLLLTWAALA